MKFKRIWLVLVILVLSAGCHTPEEKKDAFFKKGTAFFEANDFVRARLEFKNAVQIDTKFVQGYYMLGRTEMALGNAKAAFGRLSNAVKLDPGCIEARLELGKLLFAVQAMERAGEQADAILKIDPAHAGASLLKASVLLARKKIDEAGRLLGSLEGNDRNPARFYLLRASYFKAAGHNPAAGETLKKGLESYPDNLGLIMAMAKYYGMVDDAQGVETQLKSAIELAPENAGFKLNLAWLYFQTGKTEQADIILNRLLVSDPGNEKNIMGTALLLMRRGELDRCLSIVEDAMKTSPENFGYASLASEIYLKQNRIEKAEEVLWNFVSRGDEATLPDMVKAKVNLAKLLLLRKQTADAEKLIDDVLDQDPRNVDAHYLKGRLYLVGGDGAEAVSRFREVTREHPEHLEGYIGLAKAHSLNKDYDLALDVLKKALKKAPNATGILKEMVNVNVLKKDSAAAEENLKQIIDLDPYNISSIAGLGDFYLSMNRYKEAMAQYDLIKENKKGRSLGYLRTAQALARQDKIGQAVTELEAGYEKGEKSSVMMTSLGQLYLKQGRQQEAVEKFREAVEVDPKNQLAWLTLGNIYEVNQDYENAVDVYRAFLEHHPDSWSANNNLAFLLSMPGRPASDLAEAAALVNRADELNPGSALVHDTLGWIRYRQGDLDEAKKLISGAVEKLSGNPSVCYHYGVVAHALGNRKDAGHYLKKALSVRGAFPERKEAEALFVRYYE